MTEFERAAEPHAGISLPVTDAVHGDWCIGNILEERGRVSSIVDNAAAGYGTRAVDLASLLHYAYADEYADEGGQAGRALLGDEIVAIGGVPMLVVLLIYRAMALIEFAARHHGEEGVAAFVRVGRSILRDLEG
jgi:aminoglycoside phosphotransferase (APT) family kinase protein